MSGQVEALAEVSKRAIIRDQNGRAVALDLSIMNDWLRDHDRALRESITADIGGTPLPATDEAGSDDFLAGVLWAQAVARGEHP